MKLKVKVTLQEATKGPEMKQRYSYTHSLTSALEVVGGQRHDPAALSPGKTWCPLYTRLGRSQGRSGRVRKISPPPGFDPRTVQPVASRYTSWKFSKKFSFFHACYVSQPSDTSWHVHPSNIRYSCQTSTLLRQERPPYPAIPTLQTMCRMVSWRRNRTAHFLFWSLIT